MSVNWDPDDYPQRSKAQVLAEGVKWGENLTARDKETYLDEQGRPLFPPIAPLQEYLSKQFYKWGYRDKGRAIAAELTAEIKAHPEEFVSVLIDSKVIATAQLPKPPHVHDWRWNMNRGGMSDLWCADPDCEDPCRNVKSNPGPSMPQPTSWPKYEGPLPE